MKKLALLLFLMISVMISTACNSDDGNTEKETTKEETPVTEETKKEEAVQDTNPVSVQAGLGDTPARFTEQYGENKGTDMIGIFQTDYSLIPTFIKNRAIDINVKFDTNEQKTLTLEEAEQIAADLIPADAEFQKEYDTAGTSQKTMLFQSDRIAEVFPDIKPAGNFIIIYTYNQDNQDEVTGVTIGLGDLK